MNEDIHFVLLQFVDDTFLVYDFSWKNLWSIKKILRGSKLAPGLCVHLHKSKLYGINLKEDFLQAASSFLSYDIGTIPFFPLEYM